jgi:hypothetical protein
MARFSRSNQDGTPVELNSRRLRQAQQCMRQARDEKQILLPPCGIRMTDVAPLSSGETSQDERVRGAVPVIPRSGRATRNLLLTPDSVESKADSSATNQPQNDAHGGCGLNSRLRRKRSRLWRVAPPVASSAMISPTTLQNLKPWPENPAAIKTRSDSG